MYYTWRLMLFHSKLMKVGFSLFQPKHNTQWIYLMPLKCRTISVSELQCIASLKRMNKISLGPQPILHSSGHGGENSIGVSVARISAWSMLSMPSHPSLHSSSPLPPLHRVWQHPPTAGGDEALPGWWQKSERGKETESIKTQRVTNHQLPLDVHSTESTGSPQTGLKSQSERHRLPHLWNPHLCVSDWPRVKTMLLTIM